MRKSKAILFGATLAAFAVSSLAVPASAATGSKLTIINGFPGKKVDVCVNGREIRSALPYGKVVRKTTRSPKTTVKLFAKNNRARCKGTLLGKRVVSFKKGTLVITKKFPKRVVVFDMSPPAPTTSALVSSRLSVLHAADVQPVEFWRDITFIDPFPEVAAGEEILVKGDNTRDVTWTYPDTGHRLVFLAVQVPGQGEALFDPAVIYIKPDRHYFAYLIGASVGNARFVVVSEPLERS